MIISFPCKSTDWVRTTQRAGKRPGQRHWIGTVILQRFSLPSRI